MPLTPPFIVRSVAARELSGRLLQPALAVFAAALGYSSRHERVLGMADSIRRHATRAGFKGLGAFNQNDELVGFSYGYASQPGLWWREQIVPALSPAQRDFWLADAWELAELHVHPSAQGNKLGSQLHDQLLEDLPHRTALLSVMHRSQRARHLYESRGWQELIHDLRFSTEPQTPFSVMGLNLPSE